MSDRLDATSCPPTLQDLYTQLTDLLCALHKGELPAHATLESTLQQVLDASPSDPARSTDDLVQLCRTLLFLGSYPVEPAARRPAQAWARDVALCLYACERARRAPLERALLYLGVSHVACGELTIGIKHVRRFMRSDAHPDPSDRDMGWWALVSASLRRRALTTAREILHAWEHELHPRQLPHDAPPMLRNGLLQYLLALLVHQPEAVPPWLLEPPLDLASRWRPAYDVLSAWKEAIDHDYPSVGFSGIGSAPALVLGAPWRTDLPLEACLTDRRDEFGAVCALRRAFPTAASLQTSTSDQLVQLKDVYERWDLLRPLNTLGTRLREVDTARFHQHVLQRQLGAHASNALLRSFGHESAAGPVDDALILMSDVQGYSQACEDLDPQRVHDMLSPVFKMMHEELESAGGAIHEFVGDCIMVVFNTFDGQRTSPAELLNRVARCVERLEVLSTLLSFGGVPPLRLGVGLQRGPVAKGFLGGLARCHLAVLGNTVNLAARLESLTRKLPSSAAVSESVLDPDTLWEHPERVRFSLRDLGRHPLKGISEPVRVLGVDPLIRSWVDFFPMGFVADPEPGVVYLDTGGSCQPGILDTHYEPEPGATSPELAFQSACLRAWYCFDDHIAGHLGDLPLEACEFRLHALPDFDTAASLFLCYTLLADRRAGGAWASSRARLLERFARYVEEIDRGAIPEPEHLADSLYGVFVAHLDLEHTRRRPGALSHREQLEAGLRVIDAAFYLAEAEATRPQDLSLSRFSAIFAARPDWFPEERALLREDYALYTREDRDPAHTYQARVGGLERPALGLWLKRPQSKLFKHWARTDPQAPSGSGYDFLVVDWSTEEKRRFVISVDPNSGYHLRGLGAALEREESRERARLGVPRPAEPRRLPADNSDPWFFGQGHGYTIVDAPFAGTVLDADAVRRVHTSWTPDA